MISHQNIIKFYGVRKEGDVQYLFLEYASGGELFDRIGEGWLSHCVCVVEHGNDINVRNFLKVLKITGETQFS